MTEPTGETPASTQAESTGPALETARPGIPVWRVGKPDAFLAGEVATARAAVLTIAAEGDVGVHVAAYSEGVRCVTHVFESRKQGYRGWVWFASLARVSRGKEATVNEVGLLPTADSVLAPAWVPWAERVRPEDKAAAEAAAAAEMDDAGASHETSDDAAGLVPENAEDADTSEESAGD